ncbi:transglycosylase domain-containing protein [Actinomadura atramentaria]|uniref:transglycosylase domain-containing protein n=1 Tax=Actinomadura atramentaria TaxID=1990 RepID=UPI00035E7DBA|nr:transglycosylase domain-containing protein [Actinomadura atramentaria]
MLILALASLVGVAYWKTPIPAATQAAAVAQESVIYYDDGKTPLARIGTKREDVKLKDIPDHVQKAVLAAEDRGFEHEPGVSPTGVARALFKTATGGDVQGGSTITQQLARNYYAGLSQERSVSRKLKEILISIRLGNERKKDEILNLYLNTVAFGRDSYGIQAAARAYFRTDVKHLKVNQAALLAAMIQRPGYFVTTGPDSQPAKKALIYRWNYVLDGMVKEGWLSEAERAQQKFPQTVKVWSDVQNTGQTGYLEQRVRNELAALNISDQDLARGGFRIYTTFNEELQNYTQKLVKQVKAENNLDGLIHFGLTAVNPKTGGVVAAYGGPGFTKQQFDDSFQGAVQPGSSFKPVVLATALDQGISLNTTVNGAYRRVFPGGYAPTNDSTSENGVYNLVQMTQHSINTAYVDLGQKVGLDKVVTMAKKMGIPADTPELNANRLSLPLGPFDVTSVNMASVYSTFANEGKHIPVHVISKITDAKGNIIKRLPYKEKEVFSPEVAGDATKAMRAVVTSGTGTKASLGARPVAGKTGTTDMNRSAWFVGYTPQLSTAVAMWRETKDGKKRLSLKGIGGYSQIYGGDVPAMTFQRFMTKALEGKEIEQLPPPGNVGTVADWAAPKPRETTSTKPTPETTPNCRPGEDGETADGKPCKVVPTAPTTPTTPTSPPATGQPCNMMGRPDGCNPNLPPGDPAPGWWCAQHPGNAACKDEEPDGPGSGR